MADKIPFKALLDFLVNGKGREQGTFQPADADVDAVVAELEAGIQGKHIAVGAITAAHIADGAIVAAEIGPKAITAALIADTTITAAQIANATITGAKVANNTLGATQIKTGAFRILPFTGVDASGVEPELTRTLTGALAGDVVAAVIDTSAFTDQRALFATSIAVNAQIEQVSLTDLSAKTYLALLIAA